MERQVKFSIVTVCLNAEETIEATMRSVLTQTYQNYEYIIWDGKSTDSTLERAARYESRGHVRIYSEKDSGLYNAMNCATALCSGDYILFLNSGDMLADENVLQDMADEIDKDHAEADLYFGSVIRKRDGGEELETYRGRGIVFRLLLAGRMPCHQSIFTRQSVMRAYGFDESYSITADYHFLMRCTKDQKRICHVDRVISRFDCTQGISSQVSNLAEMRRQDDRSMKELYPVWYYVLKPVKAAVRFLKTIRQNGI